MVTRERLHILAQAVTQMKNAFKEGRDWDAWVVYQPIGERPVEEEGALEDILYISNQMDAKERNILKEYQDAGRR